MINVGAACVPEFVHSIALLHGNGNGVVEVDIISDTYAVYRGHFAVVSKLEGTYMRMG